MAPSSLSTTASFSEKIITPKQPSTTSSSATSTPSSIPTLIFKWTLIYTDDLVEKMCLGFRKQNAPVQSQIITYGGKSASQRAQTQCKNGKCCSKQTKVSSLNAGWLLSCDEYPFASTDEGSAGAHVGCIVAFQNGAQGDYLKDFYKKLKAGDKFMVLVEGIDCDTVSEHDIPGCNTFEKRDSQNYSNGAYYPAQQSENSGSLIIALGDMAAGQ